MIVREVTGKSFKGVAAYLLHDKEADTAERVAWTHTENTRSPEPMAAIKAMQYTSLNQKDLREEAGLNRGKDSKKNVLHLVMSWEDGHHPDQAHQIEAARSLLARLELDQHHALFVSHNDTAHSHLHIVTSKLHPETGKANQLKFSQEKQQKWALEYERQQGQILCQQRAENEAARQEEQKRRDQAREQGRNPGKAQHPRYNDHQNYWDRDAYNIRAEQAAIDAAIELEKKREAQERQERREQQDAARRQAERSRLEEDANRQRATQQSAHHAARRALDDELDRRNHGKIEAVKQQYRFSITENRRTIADLQEKLDQKGMAGMLYRARHGQESARQLEAARKSLDNAQDRQAEALNTIQQRAEAERQQLIQRQAEERAALEKELAAKFARQEEAERGRGVQDKQQSASAEFTRHAANQNAPQARPQPANQNQDQQPQPAQDHPQKLER